MEDKRKVIFRWTIALIVCISLSLIFLAIGYNINSLALIVLTASIGGTLFITFLTILIMSFFIKYMDVKLGEHIIEIYSGFINNYLKIDGEIKDEYKGITYGEIRFHYDLDNNAIDVIIPPSGHINLKINNEIVK